MEEIEMTIGEYITQRREALGMSRLELAKRAGITHTEIYRIESGERKKPSLKNLNSIAKVLLIPGSSLLNMAGYEIEDNKNLVSIEGIESEAGRDAVRQIIDGIARCKNLNDADIEMIKQQVRMTVNFIQEEKKKDEQ